MEKVLNPKNIPYMCALYNNIRVSKNLTVDFRKRKVFQSLWLKFLIVKYLNYTVKYENFYFSGLFNSL